MPPRPADRPVLRPAEPPARGRRRDLLLLGLLGLLLAGAMGAGGKMFGSSGDYGSVIRQLNPTLPPAEVEAGPWWQPEPGATWQWQLSTPPDEVEVRVEADVWDLDLFEGDAATVAALHARGRKAVCYLSAGTWEEWRPDAGDVPTALLGRQVEGWPGERWLDIRQIEHLAPALRARLDLCRAKGFDGVEPDNVDGYTADSGFLLTAEDQLAFNRWLAAEAHARGLSVGLKNDLEQVPELVDHFDWALVEECFAREECGHLAPFAAAGKAVFATEYTDQMSVDEFLNAACPRAEALGISAVLKERELGAWRLACP